MNKQPSLSKLSSRSLSKLKSKINVAFSRQSNNENQAKNMQQVKPNRSNSTKSLAKSKYQSVDRNPPFSTTIKNALFQTQRKFSTHQTPSYSSRQNQIDNNPKQTPDDLQCKHLIEGEKIVGYSWFHQQGKNISSVSKKCKDQNLRYFAMKQANQGQQKKKIIAAVEGISKIIQVNLQVARWSSLRREQKIHFGEFQHKQTVHEGRNSKIQTRFIPICASCPQLLDYEEQSVTSFTNLHKIVSLIFELITDGVRSIDAVTNIIGRKLIQLSRNSGKDKREEMFILLILMEKKIKKIAKFIDK